MVLKPMRVIVEQNTFLCSFGTDEISWRVVEYVASKSGYLHHVGSVRLPNVSL